MAPGLGVCVGGVPDEKAGLKPDSLEGGGRGGSDEELEAPGGGGYDMMNFAVPTTKDVRRIDFLGCWEKITRTYEPSPHA